MPVLAATTPLGKLVRLPLRLVPKESVVPVLSGPLRGSKWIVGSATHGCWLGSYEANKAWAFRKAIKPSDVVYDIGAHVGYYSLIAAKAGASVFAFEPLPRNLGYLDRHLAMNCAAVQVIRSAVSATNGTALFTEGPASQMGKLSNDGAITVETVAVDMLGIPAPTVVKMDIEGGEVEALDGMRATIEACRPKIFLATHGDEIKARCLGLLKAHGYRIYAFDDREFLAH